MRFVRDLFGLCLLDCLDIKPHRLLDRIAILHRTRLMYCLLAPWGARSTQLLGLSRPWLYWLLNEVLIGSALHLLLLVLDFGHLVSFSIAR